MNEKFDGSRAIGICIFCESFQILQSLWTNGEGTLFKCEKCEKGFTSSMIQDYIGKDNGLTEENIDRVIERINEITKSKGYKYSQGEEGLKQIRDLINNG